MTIASLKQRTGDSAARARTTSSAGGRRPAATAAARVSRASLLLGTLGVVSSMFVFVRLFESWRVTPQATSHRISIFGAHVSYPTANVGAVVMIVLAALGLIVTALVLRGTARELVAARGFYRRLGRQSPRAFGDATVIDDEWPRAFCAGLVRPRVYVSTGALALLDESGLDAVLAHEHHHARRRDPLRLAVGRVLAQALFFLPGLRELVKREQALAELSADESAVNTAPAYRSGLARAMLSFSEVSPSSEAAGIDPVRVDYLLGEPPSWRFPLALCLGGAAVIALLVAIAVLAGQVANGSATLAPPFLSSQPCVLVLAMIPAALGALATIISRRQRA